MPDDQDPSADIQSRLDFASAEHTQRERSAPFAEAMAVMRARLRYINPKLLLDEFGDPAPMSQRLWFSAIEVLMAIYSREYNVGYCQARPEDLAATAGRSETTYYERRRDLERVGLLQVEQGAIGRNGSRLPARISICHDAIDYLCDGSRSNHGSRYRRLLNQKAGTGRNEPEWAGFSRCGSESTGVHKETLNPIANTLPPSSPPEAVLGWGEEERYLRGLGLAEAAKAIAAARESDCRLETWLKHRSVWEERSATWRSPLGVLYARLMKLAPDLKPDEGWPPGDPSLLDSQDRDANRERYDREKAARLQWRNASTDRQTQILIGAGLDEIDATALLSGDPGKAERLAVGHIAPRLQSSRAIAMPP